MRYCLCYLAILTAAYALLPACAHPGNTPNSPALDGYASDFLTSEQLPEFGEADAALMRDAYLLVRVGLDDECSEVLLADILAREAHTLALAGMAPDAVLLWSEALALLKQSAQEVDATPQTLPDREASPDSPAGEAVEPAE